MTPISHVLSGLFALVIAGSPAAQTTYPEKGIGESIQPRSLKGTPERAIRCLNVPRTAYNRSYVNFAVLLTLSRGDRCQSSGK